MTSTRWDGTIVRLAQPRYQETAHDARPGTPDLARRLTQAELARLVNHEVQNLTGKPGTVSERTVYNWLSGNTRRPPAKILVALGAVFGCTAESLGFGRAGRRAQTQPPGDAVERRRFLAAVSGTAVAAARPAPATPRRIGRSDIERLQARFADVIARDHTLGGRSSIEVQAVALADEALALQEHAAGQRIRSSLYATAAAFVSSAMWAAIDGRRFDAATHHHQRAASLAAMSGDLTIAFRIWSHAGSMYRHMGRAADALAANDVARNLHITRRDPLFASLGHARHAAILGLTGDTAAVRQTLDRAQDALERADPGQSRPVWLVAHYDQAELDSLALAAYLSLGTFEDAEARAHRSLSLLRPHMRRSLSITTARLARAQLGQGDVDHAVHTAMTVSPTQAAHPRVGGMLSRFGRSLDQLAPGSDQARLWHTYAHDTLKRPA